VLALGRKFGPRQRFEFQGSFGTATKHHVFVFAGEIEFVYFQQTSDIVKPTAGTFFGRRCDEGFVFLRGAPRHGDTAVGDAFDQGHLGTRQGVPRMWISGDGKSAKPKGEHPPFKRN